MPGYFYDEFDNHGNMTQSYWIADKEQIADLLDNMFAGKTVAVIQESPYPVYRPSKNIEEDGDSQPGEEILEPGDDYAGDYDEKYLGRNEERSRLPSPGHILGDRI